MGRGSAFLRLGAWVRQSSAVLRLLSFSNEVTSHLGDVYQERKEPKELLARPSSIAKTIIGIHYLYFVPHEEVLLYRRLSACLSILLLACLPVCLRSSHPQGCLVNFDPPLEASDFSIPDTERLSFLYALQVRTYVG